jgi:hypothetical protein
MSRTVTKQKGVILALAAGLFVSVGDRIIFAAVLGRPLIISDEFSSIFAAGLLVAIPFFVLAAWSPSHVVSWAVALVLTALLHGWMLGQGIAYQRAPDGSGVNMSVAMAMLASPLIIAVIAISTEAVVRKFGD